MSGTSRATATGWLIASTPVFFWLTHYVAVLLHEFSHSFTAWFLGVKTDPFDIDWGGTGWWNLSMLAHVDENVSYQDALAAGLDTRVAIVAAAGPVLGNLVPYLVTRWVIVRERLSTRPVLTWLLFWYLVNGVANLYDYVPTRVFADDGDVTHFVLGSGVSRWAVFVTGSYLVLWAVVDLYRRVMPYSLGVAGLGPFRPARAGVVVFATVVLFGYFAVPALLESDPVSLFMGRVSLMAIPVVVVAAWRRNVLDPLRPPAPGAAAPEEAVRASR